MVLLNWPAFRGEERKAVQLLYDNLLALDVQVRTFRECLSLADYCDRAREPHRKFLLSISSEALMGLGIHERLRQAQELNQQFIDWKILAIRHGAITISNFAECKQALEGLIGYCPSFKDKLDRDASREASRIWEASFPGYADLRLSVAHSGKLFNSPGKREQHTMPGTNFVMGLIAGRAMTTSIGGKMPSYSLSEESAVALQNVRDAIYRAYIPIQDFSFQLPSVHEEETLEPPAQG
jgi:hypothetical protein